MLLLTPHVLEAHQRIPTRISGINWNSPFAQGLIFAAPMIGPRTHYELVGGTSITGNASYTNAGSPLYNQGLGVPTYQNNTAANAQAFPQFAGLTTGSPISVSIWHRRTDTTFQNDCFNFANDRTVYGGMSLLARTDFKVRARVGNAGGTAASNRKDIDSDATDSDTTVNRNYMMSASCSGVASTANNGYLCGINGRMSANAESGTFSGNIVYDPKCNIGGYNVTRCNGWFWNALAWNRHWGDSAAPPFFMDLYRYPFDLFTTKEIVYFMPEAAAGGATIAAKYHHHRQLMSA